MNTLFFFLISLSQHPLVVASSTDTRSLQNNAYSCPAVGSSPKTVPSNTMVSLIPSKSGEMCTLSRIGRSDGSYAPVGRSYDGLDWESVAGPYASLKFNCSGGSCSMITPLSESSDQQFVLTAFQHSITKRDEVARFFEQVTFGTTPDDLYNVDIESDLDSFYSEWVYDQIYQTPETLHRSWWRTRTSSIYEIPGKEGTQIHPCSVGSRWRSGAFSRIDKGKSVFINKINGRYHLSVGNALRTTVKSIEFAGGMQFVYNGPKSYRICVVDELFGIFGIRYKNSCQRFQFGNPSINLQGVSNPQVLNMRNTPTSKYKLTELTRDGAVSHVLVLTDQLYLSQCDELSYPYSTDIFVLLPNGEYLIHEPTLELRSNTDTSPLSDGGGSIVSSSGGKALCSNVPQTFVNEENCYISKSASGCSPKRPIDGVVRLNRKNLKRFFRRTNRPVYAVTNLRLSDDTSVSSPCSYGTVSRWKPVGSCNQNIQPQTANIFRPLIRTSLTFNSEIIDVTYEEDAVCDTRDLNTIEMRLWVDGECYATVHPDEGNVYDFFEWAQVNDESHPGNTAGYNPIMNYAKTGQHKLVFPGGHPMWRWNLNKSKLVYLGKLNDDVDFVDLPMKLKTDDVASALGIYTPTDEGNGIIVCGSRGEVKTRNTESYSFQMTRGPTFDSMSDEEYSQQRKKVWTMIALQASDQLRQRVAWALSQLLVISPSAVTPFYTETFLSYYDIFVRHAFGNYRDILKEVSYSPMMADMLSFFESKSSEYAWRRYRTRQFADENFAREIMQLFSIGLVKMNMDGTPILDDNENEYMTYTNADITEYARVWTGFTRQPGRGNVEDRDPSGNSIDPMRIKIGWRDHFPKMGLDGKYIGDGYVPCEDLPQDLFLRKGAEYRLLGKSKISELQDLMLQDSTDSSTIIVTVLPDGSRLKNRLCGSFNDSLCVYKGVVKLQSDVACTGTECSLSSIRVVQVAEGVFYEYVPPPCVYFPFIYDGTMVSKSRADYNNDVACVSRSIPVAAGACCDVDKVGIHNTCKYTGERVSLPIARSRCTDIGKNICNYSSIQNSMCGKCCNYSGYFWTDTGCASVAIIDADGLVAIERFGNPKTNAEYESLTYFRVHWGEEGAPNTDNSCGGCEVVGNFCRCGITVEETRVFSSAPSRNDVLSTLRIGGLPPSLNDYVSERDEGSVKIYSSNPNNLFTKTTVFEVIDDFGRTLFLKNLKLNVIVGSGGYNFRSPPSFYSAVPEVRDAHYETDAAIDHYFYNSNLPPFLAIRLLQRFGVSNPSPGYIQRVSTAFKDGVYSVASRTIGSGIYGDLSATVASIVLDRESRNVLVDADPASGSIREPLMKLIALMRNMQYQQTDGDATYLHNLQIRIWQESYEMPSVFSFFLPEYAPPGVIADASLVSPEAVLLPGSLEMMDGMISLIKYGLARCYSGFGSNGRCRNPQSGKYDKAAGYLSFKPVSSSNTAVINELATILTSGRMNMESRQFIHNIYSKAENEDEALRWAQQLVILSPAFHTTGTNEIDTTPRPESSITLTSCNQYKAVVHIVLKGGADSYNMLVPHSGCPRRDLYQQYRKVRGAVALSKNELLPIDASSSLQPCNRFGIHPSLPVLQELYNAGDALFLAGIGVLSKPVTKSNYLDDTKTRLFAHDAMQSELGKLDPFRKVARTAILGRLADELVSSGLSVSTFSVDTSLTALHGVMNRFSKVAMNSKTGFRTFNPSGQNDPNNIISKSAYFLNGVDKNTNGIFSETWSSSISTAVQINEGLYWAQNNKPMSHQFPKSSVGIQLQRASQLLASHKCRGSDRDVIYIESGRYDHHVNVNQNLKRELDHLNDGLAAFVNEIKAQDNWDNTVIVISSEFGRSLTPNSGGGTDHGWSGHGIMLGGSVKGGKIIGEYPDDLSSSNPLDTGRGRLIPTMPFDAPWNAVSQWLGIDDESSLNRVLPNRMSFDGMLLSKGNIFNDDTDTGSLICEDDGSAVSCIGDNELVESDDMLDDFFENVNDDDDEDDEDGVLEIDSKEGGSSITIAATLSALCTMLVVGVAYLFNRRTGMLSRFLSSSNDRTFVGRSKMACVSCLSVFGCFSFLHAKSEEPESDCDDNTAALDTSFEVDHAVFQLLQYKKASEVEIVAE